MNKDEFLRELRAALLGMPPEEIDNAIEYYEEYFAEAGPEQEHALLEKLGTPKAVAAQLRVDIVLRQMDGTTPPSAKKGISAVWMIILAIFAAPVALPVAIAITIMAFAMVVTVALGVFSFFLTFVALLVAGILLVVASIPWLGNSVAAWLICFGAGLALTGVSLLMIVLTVLCARAGFRGAAFLLNRINRKKRGNLI